MPELVINVPSYIGPSYLQVDELGFCEWVQGITWADVEMQLWYAEAMGEPADSILLNIGACDGGSTLDGFNLINKLQGLGLPIRTHITGYAASMAVPLALAADEAPEMDYTAQLMFHAASFNGGVGAETSKELRAKADLLDNNNQLLLDYMVARTGQTAEVVTEWMAKDTWFTATQAEAVGLASKVNPLAPTTTAKAAASLITARRRRFTGAVARASKHALSASAPKPRTKQARRPAAATPRPMATNSKKTAPKAGAAPQRTSLTAAQKPIAEAIKAMAKAAGLKATLEGDVAPSAEAVGTKLADVDGEDNGSLYTDGELAQGSEVFFDEALTETAADGEYEAQDGRTITVAAGVVESIADGEGDSAEASVADSTAAITAAVTAALAPVTKRLDEMEATFKKAVPATPRARGVVQSSDGKTTPKPKAAHHAGL